jgi:hypothetical protein
LILLPLLALPGGEAPAHAATWSSERVEIPTSRPVTTLGTRGRSAAVDPGGRLHVVVQSHIDDSAFEVQYLVREIDGSWSPIELVSGEGTGRNPSLAVGPDGGVHVLWEGTGASRTEVVHRYRAPGGGWSEPRMLSGVGILAQDPLVAVDSFNRAHTVWVEETGGRGSVVYARRDPDAAWTESRLLGEPGATPGTPTVAADGLGYVHVAWSDRHGPIRPGGTYNYEIFYVAIAPEDDPVVEPAQITNNGALSLEPFLAATPDGVVHLVWLDNRSSQGVTFDVFYKRYLPAVGWGKDKRFTYGDRSKGQPVIAFGANNTLNVAWEDFRHGNPEIYYRQVTYETGWDPEITRLTFDASPSVKPQIVSSPSGGLFLVWGEAQNSSTLRVFAKSGSALE